MAKQLLVYVMSVGMLIATPSIVAAQPQEPGAQMTLVGTVEAVDHAARTVTIRGSGGVSVTVDVPPTAVRFEQIKVGDGVTATFYDRISLRLKPAGEPAVDRTLEPTTAATPGDLPGATRARQRVTTVTITGWDPVNKVVTFTGPNGAAYSRRLLDSTDPKIVSGLKPGDRVDVTRTEAVTLTVQPAATESLRNRLTVSVLLGLDNQFSGKMIQEATGQTTGGAAINLEETTYDEVYGRIGIFKVGVGYRTTPRTEAVVNFVYAKSDAQDEATQIGTVGTTAQVPLTGQLHRVPVPGASRAASDGSSPARASRPLSATSWASTGTRTSVARSSACLPISRRDLPSRTASSSKNRGRSASVRPVACSSAWGPSR